jgi:hypothetical protein
MIYPMSIVRLPPMVGRRLGADIGELSEIWGTTQVTPAGVARAEERGRGVAAVTLGHGCEGQRAKSAADSVRQRTRRAGGLPHSARPAVTCWFGSAVAV